MAVVSRAAAAPEVTVDRIAERLQVAAQSLTAPLSGAAARERVIELRARSDGEWEIKLDLPRNKVLPVRRRRYSDLRKLPGV